MLTPLTEEGLKLPLSGLCWLDWDDIDEDSKGLPEDFNIPLIFHFLARLISFFFFLILILPSLPSRIWNFLIEKKEDEI